MKISTSRFGEIEVSEEDIITFRDGILGFESLQRYFLVDPGDETLILWLQSLDDEGTAFPILEPKIFKPDYKVKISKGELEQLKLESINQAKIYSILTIPEDIQSMTANLKAPLVINLQTKSGRQTVLSQNDYDVRFEMFKALKQHIISIRSQQARLGPVSGSGVTEGHASSPEAPSKNTSDGRKESRKSSKGLSKTSMSLRQLEP